MTDSWRVVRLGDVCSFEKEQDIHTGLPYVGLENIESGTGIFLGATNAVSVKSATFHFSPEHVLYGRLRPYLNKVLLPDFEGHCSTEIFPIKAGPDIAREYLFHWLSMDTTVKSINATSTGARMPRANMNAVLDFEISVPPIIEQRRIVAILDEAFEAIATAKANTEKNLQNAREWAVAQLSTMLIDGSASGLSGTMETLVAPGCTLSYGIVQPGDEVPSGLPIVRPVDLGGKTVRTEGLKRIDPALARSYARTTLEGNDLLLCVRGTTGTVAVAEPALAGANVTRGIVPIRFDPHIISQVLGYYLLCSEPVQTQIRAKTYGTALMQINIGDLRKIVVAFPPQEKQAALVEQLDAIQEAADQLTNVYESKLAALDELKKSLLHQAFTGALTAKFIDKQVAEGA